MNNNSRAIFRSYVHRLSEMTRTWRRATAPGALVMESKAPSAMMSDSASECRAGSQAELVIANLTAESREPLQSKTSAQVRETHTQIGPEKRWNYPTISGLASMVQHVLRAGRVPAAARAGVAALALLIAGSGLFVLPATAATTACTPSGTVPAGQPDAGKAYNTCLAITYSGGNQTFAPPVGRYIETRVWGAAGATGYHVNRVAGYAGFGGAGAFAGGGFVASAVTPVAVVVGEGGIYQSDFTAIITGYGGGGSRNPASGVSSNGGHTRGGGLSGIFYTSSPFTGAYGAVNTAADPIIVAAGGGGAAASSWSTSPGSGGGLTGLAGTTSGASMVPSTNCTAAVYSVAQGGTQSAGGSKGTGSAVVSGNNATNGSKWYGGNGALTPRHDRWRWRQCWRRRRLLRRRRR